MNATKYQVKMIHIFKNIIGQSELAYRQQLWRWKVTTSKDLDYEDADHLIQLYKEFAIKHGLWKELPKKAPGKIHKIGKRDGYASPEQLALIRSLWFQYSNLSDNKLKEKALNRFIAQRWNISRVEWLTCETVGKVICALRKIVKNSELKKAEKMVV